MSLTDEILELRAMLEQQNNDRLKALVRNFDGITVIENTLLGENEITIMAGSNVCKILKEMRDPA